MLKRLWACLTRPFRHCPTGPHHLWMPFQVRWRRQCFRCGRIEDGYTGESWPSVDAYLCSAAARLTTRPGDSRA